MKFPRPSVSLACISTAALFTIGMLGAPSFAQNVAFHKPIADGSGAYPNDPFYSGQFNTFQVTDGIVSEPGQTGFWIMKEDFSGQGYFTLDLGDQYSLSQIGLRNTHNSGYNDRGTQNFEILGANAIDSSHNLVSPVTITSGTITQRSGTFGDNSVIPADTFNVSGQYRYLRFHATSAYGAQFNNVGLNEIEVNGTRVPSNPNLGANIALNKPVIANSGSYPFIQGFDASNVTDGSTTDVFAANTPDSGSYWLTADNTGAGAYFVVDLQGQFSVTGLGIRNTHNWQYADRGALAFEVRGSDTIDGNNLASAPIILTGGLPNTASANPDDPIEAFQFAVANGLVAGNYRYLRFNILSAVGNNGGLNEFEVYGSAVPEPSTSAALLGLAGVGFLRRRKVR